MRTPLLLVLACALVGATVLAPTAAADITYGIDLNGDWDCNDPGETVRIPGPVHRHGPCTILA